MDPICTDFYLTVYSTLTSTLAGGFSLLVAIVLYIMQSIATHIGNCSEAILAASPANRALLLRMRSGQRWEQFIRIHAAAGQLNPALSDEQNLVMEDQLHEMRRSVFQLRRIRQEFLRATYLTGTVILASLAAMPAAIFCLSATSPVAAALMTVVMIGAMFCIHGYFRLIMTVLPAESQSTE